MRNRLLTISAAMLALIAAGCGDSEPATFAQQSSLNVLLITLDTTRADRFSGYGYDRPTTPHFDELATDGVLFELAISTASATPIAHASIMTGLNPYHHDVRVIYAGSGYYLNEEIPTLASELNKRGWETGAFLSSFTVSEFYGFEHGFDTFDNGLKNPADSIMQKKGNKFGWEVRTNQRRSDETADAAIAWISKKRKSPFFAWIHFWDPHDPALQPPDRVLAKFPQRVPGRPSRKRDTYDAEIAYVDENFGRIVAALEKNGQYDNTIIVVIADHGEGLGDHDWVNHRLLYQEQIRLPLIVRLPGGPKNVRVADLVRNIDVYPTIMEALGVTLPKKPDGRPMIDGLSMISLMNGEPQPPRIAYADQLNKWDDNAGMVRRRPLDQRTDIFNLGATMYWVLTSEKYPTAIRGTDARGGINIITADKPIAPIELNDKIPLSLSKLIMECCRDNPHERPADMKQVVSRLEVVQRIWAKQREAHRAERMGDVLSGDSDLGRPTEESK